jgi:ABC-type glycerol-3-phosphate transport system permease component
MSTRRRDRWDYTFLIGEYALLALLVGIILLPFLYALSVSVRPPSEIYGPPTLIPEAPTLEPWRLAFEQLGGDLVNSLITATGTAVISLAITIPGAYAFARTDFPGKKWAFYFIVLALLFPYVILILPIQSMWYDLGLYNTIPGLWIAYQAFVTPFAVWILRDFFQKLPANIEEAAQVYGCTQFTAFLRVILPLSWPAVASVGFLAFLIGWNDFLFANMLVMENGPQTAVVTLYKLTTGSEQTFWARMMAQSFIIGAPPAVLYMIARRSLTSAFAVE